MTIMTLDLCKNVFFEEFVNRFGTYGKEFSVRRYTNALLTFSHAECSGKFDLVAEIIVADKILKLFNYLTGAFDVARRADAYCDFHLLFSS